MLNSKEETVLVQTLIVHIINLNEEIDKLKKENEKLQRRLNFIYSKTDSPIPF